MCTVAITRSGFWEAACRWKKHANEAVWNPRIDCWIWTITVEAFMRRPAECRWECKELEDLPIWTSQICSCFFRGLKRYVVSFSNKKVNINVLCPGRSWENMVVKALDKWSIASADWWSIGPCRWLEFLLGSDLSAVSHFSFASLFSNKGAFQ